MNLYIPHALRPIFHHIDLDLPRIYVKCVLLPLIAVVGRDLTLTIPLLYFVNIGFSRPDFLNSLGTLDPQPHFPK